ncbi:GNAT family N-acetyltransferase [Desmospora activa]|uniref:Ribosomal protein S18 acetylase RimI-like enzyme n=1 Tax=Desmospora activa DSM 45169 TaxID=1121389 RepID=A0A2T4ZDF8_9BACL|nr:GNAT family N-acetyltransferase [Desmospora activa]PTM59902.1 ribosomal protein S18 acetylase RimI-like enzyme [Desmospora activa DSM 45169]
MDILIRKMTAADQGRWAEIDDSFTVDSTLVLTLKENEIGYTVKELPAYEKSYASDVEDTDYSRYIDNPDQAVYLAFAANQAVGQMVLKRNWNQYAYVEDLKVDNDFRGYGIGRQCIEQAKHWARERGMPGIMLETQSNNVSACKFYESCGFIIGGFDLCLYKGIHPQSEEVAVYWYLMFE